MAIDAISREKAEALIREQLTNTIQQDVPKNSIVMQDALIQEGAEIDHCILDKQSVIRRNGRLIAPAAYPIVIAKNVVI